MALQLNYLDPSTQIPASTAYAKILSIHIDTVQLTVDVAIGIFFNQTASQAKAVPFAIYHVSPSFSSMTVGSPNIFTTAYTFAKTVSPFIGATDVP